MVKYITNLVDSTNQPYLGIKFAFAEMEHYYNKWVEYHFEEILNNYVDMETVAPNEILDLEQLYCHILNRKNRDGEDYHLTLFSVVDLCILKKNDLYFNFTVDDFGKDNNPVEDLVFDGIGKATKGDNTSYFVVTSSKKLDGLRELVGLKPKDFHVTLGFDKKDVHGVSKGKDTIYLNF